ncbi:MAG: sulfite exporter TauE/SafE family protein [Psychrobium sp.]|nr:sulfite exporter TauE/SafE family protein [Psychrobium sp.]
MDVALHIFTYCLLLGALVGFLAGLLGIGGGLIIVPVLIVLLPSVLNDSSLLMPVVLSTSLAAILLTSISTLLAHQRSGNIPLSFLPPILGGIAIGALIGGYFADVINSDHLKLFFGCFSLFMSLQMWLGAKKADNCPKALPDYSKPSLTGVGAIVGTLSSLLGIGGGVMLVPFLTSVAKLDMRRAIGVSAAGGFVVSAMGSIGYLSAGLNTTIALPSWSLGYIYLPALLGIISLSLLTAPFGVKMAKVLPVKVLKRFFAILLFVVGSKILIT